MYSWNTTVSDHCCLACDGTVYKADSVIEEKSHEDECQSVETSICRRIPGRLVLLSPRSLNFELGSKVNKELRLFRNIGAQSSGDYLTGLN